VLEGGGEYVGAGVGGGGGVFGHKPWAVERRSVPSGLNARAYSPLLGLHKSDVQLTPTRCCRVFDWDYGAALPAVQRPGHPQAPLLPLLPPREAGAHPQAQHPGSHPPYRATYTPG
jgi:hypothetical protein